MLVGSGTGTVLEGAWSDEVVPEEGDNSTDSSDDADNETNSQ